MRIVRAILGMEKLSLLTCRDRGSVRLQDTTQGAAALHCCLTAAWLLCDGCNGIISGRCKCTCAASNQSCTNCSPSQWLLLQTCLELMAAATDMAASAEQQPLVQCWWCNRA